jgi:hypothetical protein
VNFDIPGSVRAPGLDHDALDQLPDDPEGIGPIGLVRSKEGGLKVSHLTPVAFRDIWVELD